MEHYKFFRNQKCEYFPCHPGAEEASFNCLLCFCPLYALGEKCGGNFTYTQNGIKDCTNCLRPHRPENYDGIMQQMAGVLELAKRRNPQEKT